MILNRNTSGQQYQTCIPSLTYVMNLNQKPHRNSLTRSTLIDKRQTDTRITHRVIDRANKIIQRCYKLSRILIVAILLFSPLAIDINLLVNADNVSRPQKVLELTSDNYDESTSIYQIVVLNFYADWCPYSARWKPIFQETAKSIYTETQNTDPSTIVFGQINCEIQTTLAQRFRITKFPTTKLTLNGKPCKKEYRGARTAEAFKEYVKKFLSDPIVTINEHDDLLTKIDERRGAVIMYSGRVDEHGGKPISSPELEIFRRVAQTLREDCQFFYVTNAASGGKVQPPELYQVTFKPQHKSLDDERKFPTIVHDYATLNTWAKDGCIPLVREITFENAEELTEDGLPFVILFYDPRDKTWIEVYKRIVEQELRLEASGVTFLYADGYVFSHPLKHLGKTTKDLPLVAIDSFKHLFLYKRPIATISQPGMLKQFIADLHSGKLDREFHFGPDPLDPSLQAQTSPPESAFNKLQPSAYRYSLLMPRDEL